MLSLQLKSGEYLTIGDDIAVQVFEQSGSSFRVSVQAPKELPILRGEVLERTAARPGGLRTHRPQSPSERTRNDRRDQTKVERQARAAGERRRTAEQDAVTKELRRILENADQLIAAHGSASVRLELDALRERLAHLERPSALG